MAEAEAEAEETMDEEASSDDIAESSSEAESTISARLRGFWEALVDAVGGDVTWRLGGRVDATFEASACDWRSGVLVEGVASLLVP